MSPAPRPAALLAIFGLCAAIAWAQPPAAPEDPVPTLRVEQAPPVQLTPAQVAEMEQHGSPLEADFFGLTAPIPEGEAFAFEIRGWTAGPVAPSGEVSFRIPDGALLAGRPVCESWTFEPEVRTFTLSTEWQPGRIYNCSVQLLAPENKGNLYFTLEKRSFLPQAYDRVEREVPMSSPAAKVLFRLGRVGFTTVSIAVLLPLMLVFASILLGQRERRRRPEAIKTISGYELFTATVIGLGLLSYFVVMAVGDARSLGYPEKRCEILDVERLVHEKKGQGGRQSTYSFDTRMAVAYQLEGQRQVAIGGRPESFFDLSDKKAAELLEGFERGSTVPCYLDPKNPSQVLVDRGFGGAYVFALIPLGLLATVFSFWRR